MAGLLADVLSLGNTARRKLRGLLDDPAGTLQMQIDRVMPTQYEQRAEFDRMAGKQHNTAAAKSAQAKVDQLAQDAALNAITVYHGSPHKFDKFDMSKIGTGEGAQAYGHGLYFAEAPETAKAYQDSLAYKAFDIAPEAEKRGFKLNAGGRGEFIRQVKTDADSMTAAKRLQYANIAAREVPQEKLAELIDAYRQNGGGALYKVDLPDEAVARFLDWDKPLSQQGGVSAFSKLPEFARPLDAMEAENVLGQRLHQRLANRLGENGASKVLAEAGIPGIRYLDGGSRGTGTGTSNFVVFDDTLPTILERNGAPLGLLNR